MQADDVEVTVAVDVHHSQLSDRPVVGYERGNVTGTPADQQADTGLHGDGDVGLAVVVEVTDGDAAEQRAVLGAQVVGLAERESGGRASIDVEATVFVQQ